MKNKLIIKIHKAWQEIKTYQKKLGGRALGSTYGSYRDFKNSLISAVLDGKDVSNYARNKTFQKIKIKKKDVQELKQNIRWKVKGKIAKVEFEKYSELRERGFFDEGEEIKTLKDFRSMTTRDFADLIKSDIKKHYKELITKGKTGKEAKKEISSFYFGS